MSQETGVPKYRTPIPPPCGLTPSWGLKHCLRGLFLPQGPQGREAGPVIHSGGEQAVVPALHSQLLPQVRKWGPWQKAAHECEVVYPRSAFQVQAS